MGLIAKLYLISRAKFVELNKEPKVSRIPDLTIDYKQFDGNFEATRFLLKKSVPPENQGLIDEIFYPTDYLGHFIDFESVNYKDLKNLSIKEDWPIPYLSPIKVNQIRSMLNQIEKSKFLEKYNAKELNDNGIYPQKWHNDKSTNQVFSIKNIENGYDDLIKLFNKAADNKFYILTKIG